VNGRMTLINTSYYALKPFLPRGIRYAIRRLRAHYKLFSARDWPIMESAARTPAAWAGWPEGKKFALTLTHDVENRIGLDRCVQLAEIECRLGFRSSFNFIPEGEYRVGQGLRDNLAAAGFEIGVHDFHHDGSLYRSHGNFVNAAKAINQYLKEWGAVGFRAGFMFHNLDWLQHLEIEYDASTFDTDPFEPQPEGVGTIFPFLVKKEKAARGYIELPYTLPQDSTLFLIFREKAVDVWKRKVDWLAEKGGMALVNVHPDYLAFKGKKPGISEFPAELYEEFLSYVKEKYEGAYWHALPRDIARYIRRQQVFTYHNS
jgi:hypothetical protein